MEFVTIGVDIKWTEIPPPVVRNLIEKITEKFLFHIKFEQSSGPISLDELPELNFKMHTPPLSAKFISSGKNRLLIDESAPKNHSINSVLPKENKSVTYISFERLMPLLFRIRPYGWLWVIDPVNAYYRTLFKKCFTIYLV